MLFTDLIICKYWARPDDKLKREKSRRAKILPFRAVATFFRRPWVA
jgi:hypothetical protein